MKLIEWPYYRTDFLASQGLSPTFVKRFWAKVYFDGSVPTHCPELGCCWIWSGHLSKDGYGRIWMRNDPMILAHRASWLLRFGFLTDELVLHFCDNRRCVRPTHLFLGDHAANNRDRAAKGRNAMLRGEANPFHRLTTDQVIEIRSLYASRSVTASRLGQRFGVSPDAIWKIIHRVNWKHL